MCISARVEHLSHKGHNIVKFKYCYNKIVLGGIQATNYCAYKGEKKSTWDIEGMSCVCDKIIDY
ncbi:hypothetical protein AN958_00107 [Leucoagaricus sp. SymC.cos]|nr:hypothetical protein AN958_00107 [Leucoagaricus sp. SymC.cos]